MLTEHSSVRKPTYAGATLDRADALLRTALSCAAQNEHAAIIAALLAAGASTMTHRDSQQAPLYAAAWAGHTGVVRFVRATCSLQMARLISAHHKTHCTRHG